MKDAAKNEGANRLNSMALGTIAGVDEDKDGHLSYDIKRGLIGAAVGVVAGRQVQKMFTGTRLPGASKAIKREVKALRTQAKKLKAEGKSAEEIFIETGLFQGPEGRWRQELDDSNIKWNLGKDILDRFAAGDTVKYGEVVQNHPELFKRYPALAEMPITKTKSSAYSGGFVASNTDPAVKIGKMELDYKQTADEIKSTVLHEGQHGVQYAEGHERGGSPTGLLMKNLELSSDRDVLTKTVKAMQADPTVPPEMLKNIKKDLKRVKSRLRHLGLYEHSDNMYKQEGLELVAKKKKNLAEFELDDLVKQGKKGTPEHTKVLKQFYQHDNDAKVAAKEAEKFKRLLHAKAEDRYYKIAGEQESRMTEDRRKLASMIRMMSMPKYAPDTLQMSRLSDRPVVKPKIPEPEFSIKQSTEPGTIGEALKINTQTSAMTAGMGALYNGID